MWKFSLEHSPQTRIRSWSECRASFRSPWRSAPGRARGHRTAVRRRTLSTRPSLFTPGASCNQQHINLSSANFSKKNPKTPATRRFVSAKIQHGGGWFLTDFQHRDTTKNWQTPQSTPENPPKTPLKARKPHLPHFVAIWHTFPSVSGEEISLFPRTAPANVVKNSKWSVCGFVFSLCSLCGRRTAKYVRPLATAKHEWTKGRQNENELCALRPAAVALTVVGSDRGSEIFHN